MAFQFDESHVYDGQQLVCKNNVLPVALGLGPSKIKCSSYHQGPLLVGSPGTFPSVFATVMIAPSAHGSPAPAVPGGLCSGISNPYSLAVSGSSAFLGQVDTNANIGCGGNVLAQGHVISNCGGPYSCC